MALVFTQQFTVPDTVLNTLQFSKQHYFRDEETKHKTLGKFKKVHTEKK